jgi:hypothetical protein
MAGKSPFSRSKGSSISIKYCSFFLKVDFTLSSTDFEIPWVHILVAKRYAVSPALNFCSLRGKSVYECFTCSSLR